MTGESDGAVRRLADQTASLVHVQDHITRVISNLTIPQDAFADQYESRNRPDFSFGSLVRVFLYQHARGFNQSELADRLQKWPDVCLRLDLDRAQTF